MLALSERKPWEDCVGIGWKTYCVDFICKTDLKSPVFSPNNSHFWFSLKEKLREKRLRTAWDFVWIMAENSLNLPASLPDNSLNMIPLKENWACIREKIARKSAFLRMILQPEIVRDFVKMLSSVISILCSVCERIGRYLFPKIIQQFTSFLSKLFLNPLLSLYCVKTKIVSIRETVGAS